jgi:peptidoglycan LD-endopeptidase LytH
MLYEVPRWVRWPIALLVGFCVGALVDFWLTHRPVGERQPPTSIAGRPADMATSPSGPAATATSGRGAALPPVAEVPHPGAPADVTTLHQRRLTPPIDGADVERWKGSFSETHGGHPHEAVDILAPRGTAVHAVDAGSIAKLFTSKAGGLTIYQFDPARQFVYYYAHLDSYQPGLHEGDPVAPGQVIGFVGTTGNSPPGTPHLHFAISRLGEGEGWWQGTPLDPYDVFKR